jgi:carbon storage regulator
MLVLSRKKFESIMIGEDIEISVVEIAPGQVRLGIKAPRDVEIHRKEIFEAIREESRRSLQTSRNVELMKDQLKGLFKDFSK